MDLGSMDPSGSNLGRAATCARARAVVCTDFVWIADVADMMKVSSRNCIRNGPLQLASHCLCRHGTANSRHSHSCKSCWVVGKKFAIQCARVAKLNETH